MAENSSPEHQNLLKLFSDSSFRSECVFLRRWNGHYEDHPQGIEPGYSEGFLAELSARDFSRYLGHEFSLDIKPVVGESIAVALENLVKHVQEALQRTKDPAELQSAILALNLEAA